MFDVNADFFRAVSLFQSTEKTRFYLAGVHIEPHPVAGVILAATDGYRMLVVHDESGICDGRYIVNIDKSVLAIKRANGQKDANRLKAASPSEPASVVSDHGVIGMHPRWQVEGTFPDWRRITPKKPPVAHVAWYDSSLISAFDKAGRFLGDAKTVLSITATSKGGGPSIVRFANMPHVYGVLIPCRGVGTTGLPEFMQTFSVEPALTDANASL